MQSVENKYYFLIDLYYSFYYICIVHHAVATHGLGAWSALCIGKAFTRRFAFDE